jgi:hypothetical protein
LRHRDNGVHQCPPLSVPNSEIAAELIDASLDPPYADAAVACAVPGPYAIFEASPVIGNNQVQAPADPAQHDRDV